ncbi:PHP domain [Rubrobacter radiotolerans]|uniref:DNA-directed DNA polymerase n=1 Tax=Rubrobacter radiotolerans TaxID=42256 RepID=A0A023WZX1_RUBRA|nr:DNA polymerase/3'-5' exonuclease PolX [Rubrobacter radiotolerans]AHY45359.1 PHP domain [Rubrobacter radiotolerans]MDX5892770.1 DNA polymerase/3'-5' exonuclease PolX [Rubrobacter radiotolerans]SMC02464.1 DNA polymerase (family 10) [Rubrobacter radiotolerans DSM 5868]
MAERAPTNAEIVRALEAVVALMEIRGDEHYRVLAYTRAAESVANHSGSVAALDDPKSLPHVGGTTSQFIADLVEGRMPPVLDELMEEIPRSLVEVTRLPGVGPRTAGRLWKELGVTSVEEVAALDPEEIGKLKGFGKKSAEKIVAAAERYDATERRLLLDDATAIGEALLAFVRSHPSTDRADLAGSLRRGKETIGDLDLVAASTDPAALSDAFAGADFVREVVAHGPSKVSIKVDGPRRSPDDLVDVDLRIVRPEAYGTLLHHFTGSQAHNIVLRERAVKRGINISEYGLASEATGGEPEPVATEEELYERLGLSYIPPELREDAGELRAAENGTLPDLIETGDIRGDLHVHTNYSDGKGTIRSMAEAAIELGYEYLVFCDHSQSLRVANGLSPERLARKLREVREADEEYDEIRLFCGSEVDILKDGSLDYEDALLAELDFVVASVHTSFGVGEKAMTERIRRAMNNEHVRTIAHPTGRVLNRRDPYEVDVQALIAEARATNTALELNAYPDRLDLKAEHARAAVEAGVKLTIDTDAHDESALGFMRFGVAQARRAWVEKGNVINTLPLREFEAYLKAGK